MLYYSSNLIVGESLGTSLGWFRWFGRAGAKRIFDLEIYLDTVYTLAPMVGIAAHKVVCQFIHETSENGVPASSDAWQDNVNPARIGATHDSKRNWHDFGDGRTAAIAHLVHLCLYVFGTVPEALRPHENEVPRDRAVDPSILGKKTTLHSLGGSTLDAPTWATDPRYGEKWADILNKTAAVYGDFSSSPPTPAPATLVRAGGSTVPTNTFIPPSWSMVRSPALRTPS